MEPIPSQSHFVCNLFCIESLKIDGFNGCCSRLWVFLYIRLRFIALKICTGRRNERIQIRQTDGWVMNWNVFSHWCIFLGQEVTVGRFVAVLRHRFSRYLPYGEEICLPCDPGFENALSFLLMKLARPNVYKPQTIRNGEIKFKTHLSSNTNLWNESPTLCEIKAVYEEMRF